MRRRRFSKWALVLALTAPILAACSGDKGPYLAPGQETCDDGGSGGVVVDGVCL